ncbi:hypothetical protein BV898_16930 [Hypsibius exemplaris]|uniref:Uncharacterized protein n=1 Tax=Hypsibius exemplaris TaxID=2072580 RepID=A0A9X6RM40_HYPEX|nr:hypothetical protein BV898_16930 [Hypsibius exemplaris]
MEVMLEEGCAGCPIHLSTNELAENRNVGYSIQDQRTFVWSAVGTEQKPCDLKRMMVRSSCLYNDSGVLRLRNTDKQMDFVLSARRKTCQNDGVEVFSVKGVNPMSILILEWPSAGRWRRATNSSLGGKDDALSLQQLLPEYMQYMLDTVVDYGNRLADAINELNCRAGKDRLNTLYILTKVSGILAARSVRLTNYQSLESFGATGVIRQGRSVKLDFKVDNSSQCRPQPRVGDYGIGHDGFLVVPYSECLWKSSVVNFNGNPYKSRNEEWRKIRSTLLAESHAILVHFTTPVDLSGNMLSAAMEQEHTRTFNLLSEWPVHWRKMCVDNIRRLVESWEKVVLIPDIFARFTVWKNLAGGVTGLLFTAAAVFVYWQFRVVLFGCFRRLRKPSSPPQPSITTSSNPATGVPIETVIRVGTSKQPSTTTLKRWFAFIQIKQRTDPSIKSTSNRLPKVELIRPEFESLRVQCEVCICCSDLPVNILRSILMSHILLTCTRTVIPML